MRPSAWVAEAASSGSGGASREKRQLQLYAEPAESSARAAADLPEEDRGAPVVATGARTTLPVEFGRPPV
eukprot:gene301-511_t